MYINNLPIRGNTKGKKNVFPTTAPPAEDPRGDGEKLAVGNTSKLARITEKNGTLSPGGTKPRAGEYERNGYFTELFGLKDTIQKETTRPNEEGKKTLNGY